MWGRKKEMDKSVVEVAILCKFSFEDGVWNASATQLPVAAFGHTFEEAQKNLGDALLSHLESLERAGQAEEVIERLRFCSRMNVSLDEMPASSPLMKMLVGVQGREFVPMSV